MFKVNNRNTRARCEICSKLTIKTPERRHCSVKKAFLKISQNLPETICATAFFNEVAKEILAETEIVGRSRIKQRKVFC